MTKIPSLQTHFCSVMESLDCLVKHRQTVGSLIILYVTMNQMAWLSVEGDDSAEVVKDWMKKYLDLPTLGCSEDDLWAARNGLLHMGNTMARDVKRGAAKQIFYSSGPLTYASNESIDVVVIHVATLVKVFFAGVTQFLADLEADTSAATVAEKKAKSMLTFFPVTV